MSGLGRTVFGRIWTGFQRKARSYEDLGGRIITNFGLLRRYLFYGVVAYSSGEVFKYFIIENGSSEGTSMYPTMSEKTPFTLTSKLHSHGKNMSPGDIINFTSPIFRDQLAGKRVIGVAGDYIVLDAHQSASVGGAAVPGITDWRSQKEIQGGIELKEREEPKMIEVPEGHIYVVGDNMSWSRDSRFYGAVPMALVNGKQILHGGFGRGWHWTNGEQMRRIPKEEEEEYLKHWQQKREVAQAAGLQNKTTPPADKAD